MEKQRTKPKRELLKFLLTFCLKVKITDERAEKKNHEQRFEQIISDQLIDYHLEEGKNKRENRITLHLEKEMDKLFCFVDQ